MAKEELHLYHDFIDSPYGEVLLFASNAGISLLSPIVEGEDKNAIISDSIKRYKEHKVILDLEKPKGFDDWCKVLSLWFAQPFDDHNIPLDLVGTEFQQKVWQGLLSIPAGKISSYGALAAQIGSPSASRAVGAACGANKICFVVPCHRVVGSKGMLTGYRWGTEMKADILRLEGSLAQQELAV